MCTVLERHKYFVYTLTWYSILVHTNILYRGPEDASLQWACVWGSTAWWSIRLYMVCIRLTRPWAKCHVTMCSGNHSRAVHMRVQSGTAAACRYRQIQSSVESSRELQYEACELSFSMPPNAFSALQNAVLITLVQRIYGHTHHA